ncbi:hypothetical protein [Barnesiella intestinihominis]|uniref:hypothetical protein n=1 Tax=Barnesiella intestinihominis TaxID=487174 RepID=UPI0039673F1A
MKRVLNLFLAVLLVCTVNGLGDLQAQSNNKVAQLEKLSAIENNPQANCCYPSFPENRYFR